MMDHAPCCSNFHVLHLLCVEFALGFESALPIPQGAGVPNFETIYFDGFVSALPVYLRRQGGRRLDRLYFEFLGILHLNV